MRHLPAPGAERAVGAPGRAAAVEADGAGGWACTSPMIARPSVVLPLPLSPTMPRVSACAERRATPPARRRDTGRARRAAGPPTWPRRGSARPGRRPRAAQPWSSRWQRATCPGAARIERRRHDAALEGVRAARPEHAAPRQLDQARHVARDGRQLARSAARSAPDRTAAAPACRDGAAGGRLAHRAALDHLAGVHDDDPVAQLGDQAEMVRDEQDRALRPRP